MRQLSPSARPQAEVEEELSIGFSEFLLIAACMPSQLGSIITLVGIVIGAGMIVYQLDRQHRNSLRLQQSSHKQELKLMVHEQISQDIRDAVEKQKAIQMLITDIMRQYNNCLLAQETGRATTPKLYTTITDLQRSDRDAVRSITRLMGRLEEYEMIAANLKIFRVAFASAVWITAEAYQYFLESIFNYLPCDIPRNRQEQLGTEITRTESPTRKDLPMVDEAYHHYFAALVECYCMVSDLSRELQNVLLGDLFENTVPPREPTVSCSVVVTTKPEEFRRLTDYFTKKDAGGLTQHQRDLTLRAKLVRDEASIRGDWMG